MEYWIEIDRGRLGVEAFMVGHPGKDKEVFRTTSYAQACNVCKGLNCGHHDGTAKVIEVQP